jgi:hypothetical protein
MKLARNIVLGCLLLTPGTQLFAQSDDAFADLPYDEAQVRATIERYSLRIEGKAGAEEIPGSVGYRMFFQYLVSDPEPGIEEPDLLILRNLAVASTGGLAGKHADAQRDVCGRLAQSDGSRESIIELATLLDQSRSENERELDMYVAEMLGTLTPEVARMVETKWAEFSATTNLVHTTFDMPGFAQEMPEAAQVLLADGCTEFADANAQQ